jgi:hypothetical protein
LRNRRGAAKWPEKLFVVLAICFFSLFGTVALGVYWIFSVATNPSCIQGVASSFMAISDPLPHGCFYFQGICLFAKTYVRIVSSDTSTSYSFSDYIDKNLSSDISIEKLVNRAAAGEVLGAFGSEGKRRIAVAKQGTLLVGKQSMAYVMGHVDMVLSSDKTTTNCFIGVAKTPSKGKLVVLMVENLNPVVNKSMEPMTIERVRWLTDGIEAFR